MAFSDTWLKANNGKERAALDSGRFSRVALCFRQWHEAYCQKNKKGAHDILRSFEIHVFPVIGKLPVAQVSLHEWLNRLEKHAALRPDIAERILINAKQMLKWAVRPMG